MDSTRADVRSVTCYHDHRHPARVGRHARLELRFGRRRGTTTLVRGYAEPPLRLGHCLPDVDGGVHFILASSAPGIFGGDLHRYAIVVERGARVRLTSQSALQVHASRHEDVATATTVCSVEPGGHLACHWDAIIPFRGARFDQRLAVDLEGDGFLYWSDAVMSGRASTGSTLAGADPRDDSGERWMFRSFRHELRVSRDAVPEYLERYRLCPNEGRVAREVATAGGSYFGTFVMSGRGIGPEEAAQLHGRLNRLPNVKAAADAMSDRLLVAKLIASSGAAFREARDVIARATLGQRVCASV